MCCVPWKKPLLLCQEIMIFQLIYIQRGAAELRLCFSGSSAGRVQLSASAACWVSHKVQKMTTKNYKRLQIIHLKKHIEASKKCNSLWKYCCWSSWPSQFFFSAAPLSCVGGQHWRITERKNLPFSGFKWPLKTLAGTGSFSAVSSAPQPLSQVTNVIMFIMFASRTATICFTGTLLLPQTPTDSEIAQCHPSLLFFPSLAPRYLISNLVNFSAVS